MLCTVGGAEDAGRVLLLCVASILCWSAGWSLLLLFYTVLLDKTADLLYNQYAVYCFVGWSVYCSFFFFFLDGEHTYLLICMVCILYQFVDQYVCCIIQ